MSSGTSANIYLARTVSCVAQFVARNKGKRFYLGTNIGFF